LGFLNIPPKVLKKRLSDTMIKVRVQLIPTFKKRSKKMADQFGVYKCEQCGTIVEVLNGGEGVLSCCGVPMKFFAENRVDAAKDKHVPVIEKTPDGYKVSVGLIAHPMEEKHYIEWIELLADGISYKKFLQPGAVPEAEFSVPGTRVSAREYCSLHGLWKA
jgi:superoxide reductase